MNVFKNIKLRYRVFKHTKEKLYVIRMINKEMDRLRNECRLDPTNMGKSAALTGCYNALEQWKKSFGHSVLLLIGEYPLNDDGWLTDEDLKKLCVTKS